VREEDVLKLRRAVMRAQVATGDGKTPLEENLKNT
jgi:hypothetical protein